jgi:monoamine oxidase
MRHGTTRREFGRLAGFLGLGAAGPGWLTGCKGAFTGDVVIVGAGAAGLTAGWLLGKAGVPYTVLEASGGHGGRLQKLEGFVDFPLELGGEWVHTRAGILDDLSQTRDAKDRTIEYRPMTAKIWDGSTLSQANGMARGWRGEQRFEDTSWYDFFNDLIAPPVLSSIRYETPVADIAYDRDGAVLTTASGEEIAADKVIFTAPIQLLKEGRVRFDPPLPDDKTDAMKRVFMPPGLKVFMEFAESFYPHVVGFDDPRQRHHEFERVYYDVALDKPTTRHVLGLYAVGDPADRYLDHDTDEARIAFILAELDAMFGGAASQHYIQHHTQNWRAQPWARGTFSMYRDWRDIEPLGKPLDDTVHFAGEAYNLRDSWGFAHLASRSAYDVVDAILG